MAQIPAIANEESGPSAQFPGHHFGGTSTNHHFDGPSGKEPLGFRKPFQQEGVMTQVGFRVSVGDAETGHQGLVQLLGLAHGMFQGVVVVGPLGLLHPVEHVVSPDGGPIVEFPDSFLLDLFCTHGIDLSWIRPRDHPFHDRDSASW